MDCQVLLLEYETLLAIPVGAYSVSKKCPNKAKYKVSRARNKPKILTKTFNMCPSCLKECKEMVGEENIKIEKLLI